MKRFNIILAAGFSIAYSTLLSLGMACFLSLLGIYLAAAIFGGSPAKEYPRFIPFCFFVGLIVLIAIIILFVCSVKISQKYKFTKKIRWGQRIAAVLLSIPMLYLWEFVFAFLQKTF